MLMNHTAYLNLRDYESQGKYKTADRDGSRLSLLQGTRDVVNPLVARTNSFQIQTTSPYRVEDNVDLSTSFRNFSTSEHISICALDCQSIWRERRNLSSASSWFADAKILKLARDETGSG